MGRTFVRWTQGSEHSALRCIKDLHGACFDNGEHKFNISVNWAPTEFREHRNEEHRDTEAATWVREGIEVYRTNAWHRRPLWRPQGEKIKYSAQPLEGEVCWVCGENDHEKANCPDRKTARCTECGATDHLVQMCFRACPEYDFRNWEDGVAYPGRGIIGTPEEDEWLRRKRQQSVGRRR